LSPVVSLSCYHACSKTFEDPHSIKQSSHPLFSASPQKTAKSPKGEYNLRKYSEVWLLVNRASLSGQDMERIISFLGDEKHERRVSLVKRLAEKIDQLQIDRLADLVQRWSDKADFADAIAALAPRLSTERVLDLLRSGSLRLDVIERLLQSLPASEQDEWVRAVYKSVIDHPNPAICASALGMLGRFDVPSLDKNELQKRLEEALEQIDWQASRKEFVFLAKKLPTNSPYRTRLVAAALNKKAALDDWGVIVGLLAEVAPPAMLLELLSSLEPLEVWARIAGLHSLSGRIAEQLSTDKKWDAWKDILRFTSRDLRRDLLAQLRSVLPLIERLTPELLIAEVADQVFRVQRSFP
jgi:hypothetical protein